MSGRHLLVFSDYRQDLVSHGFFKKGEITGFCAPHFGIDGEMRCASSWSG